MQTAIVKYNAGNIRSVLYALERIGVQALVTEDPDALRSAGHVIFPGVGEASSAMRYLRERKLDTVIRDLEQPVLGICLGMQLLCDFSEENNTECLGIFSGARVSRFSAPGPGVKVPQVGWNTICNLQGSLFRDIPENSYCYYVHSYYVPLCPETIAATRYGGAYSAALSKNNFYGVQFHPEKSGTAGSTLLKNFLSL